MLKNKEVTLSDNINEKAYYDDKLGKIIKLDDTRIGTLNVLNRSCTNKLSKRKYVITIDIDFDKYINISKEEILAKEVSKYPEVELDYTIIVEDKKYADLKEILDKFISNLIRNYKLVEVYENKYLIRYTLGSNSKTLEQKELQTFKERFIKHVKESGLNILE